MSDTYSTVPDDEAAEGPMPPQEETGEPGEGKQSQQAVNYTAGTPLKNCGLCLHFEGVPGDAPDGCESVDGAISPFGFCDIYTKQQNPFGDQHQYTMSGGQITPAAGKPSGLRIGNKSYG